MQAEHFDATNDEYHASPGESNSKLSDYLYDPAYYHKKHILRTIVDAPKDCYKRGNGVHGICLLDNFAGKLVMPPKDVLAKNGARSTKAYYAWEEEQVAAGLITLSQDMYDSIRRYCDAVDANPDAKRIIDEALALKQTEYNVRWQDDETGLLCRCRFDIFHPEWDADIKTCRDNSPRKFTSSIWEYGYHRQGNFYGEGSMRIRNGEVVPFLFFAVTEASCHIYDLSEDFQAAGRDQVRTALRGIAEARKTGKWQRPQPRITTLELPNYAHYQSQYEPESETV